MQQLLTEQCQQSQGILPTQMFDLQRLVVHELREILELRNCEKFYAAIDLMNVSLAPLGPGLVDSASVDARGL